MHVKPEIPLLDDALIKSYCQYALSLHLKVQEHLTNLHGMTPSTLLVDETFRGALRPLVYVADQLQEKIADEKGGLELRIKVDPSKNANEIESLNKSVDAEINWLNAMSKKYDLNITNPSRVRMNHKFQNGEYRELLSKMTQHGYIESDGDFVKRRVKN